MSKRPQNARDIGDKIPLLPLSGALLLPQTQRPFIIFEPRYAALIEHILASRRILGLIQPQNGDEESPKGHDVSLQKVGTLGYLRAFEEHDDNKYMIVLEGLCRFDLREEIQTDTPFRMAKISMDTYQQDFDPKSEIGGVDRDEFLTLMRTYSKFANFEFDWEGIKSIDTVQLVNMCCVMSPYGTIEKQALLEAKTLEQRAQTLIALAQMEMATANSEHFETGIQ